MTDFILAAPETRKRGDRDDRSTSRPKHPPDLACRGVVVEMFEKVQRKEPGEGLVSEREPVAFAQTRAS